MTVIDEIKRILSELEHLQGQVEAQVLRLEQKRSGLVIVITKLHELIDSEVGGITVTPGEPETH